MTTSAHPVPAHDTRVITLISVAHAASHFNQLVLPPLFPFLIDTFGVGYTELGLMMTLFYATSGLAQTPAGFAVDRFGARNVLTAGTALMCGATVLLGLAPNYWSMLPLVVLAGLGNSVFHPSDYSILSASVNPRRLGRAYGMHTLGGNLGWAAAPVSVLALTTFFGWRVALVTVGLLWLAIPLLLLAFREDLRGDANAGRRAGAAHGQNAVPGEALGPLLSFPVVTCFVYFLLLSISLMGVQSFLPSTLDSLYGTPLDWANAALTGFLLGGSAGVVVGGILADRAARHDLLVVSGLTGAAVLFVLVGLVQLASLALIATMTLAGFLSGMTTPSRDMLVRNAAPKGATGRVFGFVYSGLDAGSSVGPLVIGVLLDHRLPALVLPWIAAILVLAGLSTLTLSRARAPAALPAE
jgi:MFS family permease